jgi:hypothetical protein
LIITKENRIVSTAQSAMKTKGIPYNHNKFYFL